jgi:hypothetical protein
MSFQRSRELKISAASGGVADAEKKNNQKESEACKRFPTFLTISNK